MKLRCRNPKCGNEWEYKGNGKFYATCSKCKSSVRITDEEAEDEYE